MANERRRFILAMFLAAACAAPAFAQGDSAHLVILHMNDTHGVLLPSVGPDGSSEGGAARVASMVRQARREMPGRVLFFNAGDVLSRGGPLTSGYGGLVDFRVLEESGLDALTPGNGDCYFGLEDLQRDADSVRFPLLHANLERPTPEGGSARLFRPYIIRRLAGLRVAILGLGIVRMEHPSARGLTLLDPAKVAATLVPVLRQQADVVVVLSHLGLEGDCALAAAVAGIDVIVGGHSHSVLDRPIRIRHAAPEGDTWVVQAGDLSRYLGRLDIHATRDEAAWHVTRVTGRLLPVDAAVPEAPDIRSILAHYQRRLDRVIAECPVDVSYSETGDSPMDVLAAGMMRSATGADAALLGRGAIAAGIARGPVTLADVQRIHPWRSRIFVVKLTDEQIRRTVVEAGLPGIVVGDAPQAARSSGGTSTVAMDSFLLGTTAFLREAPAVDSGRRLDDILADAIKLWGKASQPARSAASSPATANEERMPAVTDAIALSVLVWLVAPAAAGPLADGPAVAFENQQDAIVYYETERPVATIVEYAGPDGVWRRAANGEVRVRHEARLPDLARSTKYRYRIVVPNSDGEQRADEYTLNTEFDFSVRDVPAAAEPYPRDGRSSLCARAAQRILASTGVDRGYCIDYGCGDGRLAFEIARRSHLQVIGLSEDADAVARGRSALLAAGLYGARVTLRTVGSLADIPAPDLGANLIVSGEVLATGRLVGDATEIVRKLRPEGGKACFVVRGGPDAGLTEWLAPHDPPPNAAGLPESYEPVRPEVRTDGPWLSLMLARTARLPGAGEWTCAYGDAGQTANSFDERLSGTAGETIEMQWFGLPGPNAMLDRQVRGEGPVYAAGRVYTQGNGRLIAQDAYNGTILWSLEIPGLRRTNLPRNTGNVCANDDSLFVAVRGRCWQLAGQTGELLHSYPVVAPEGGRAYEWGYVAATDGLLLGSAVRQGNFDDDYIGPDYWYDEHSGPDVANVVSENLFACDIETGRTEWVHSGGLVVNPTIAVSAGRAFFVESRSPSAKSLEQRKIGDELWEDTWLVALDLRTGSVLWQQRYEQAPPIVIYLVAYDGRLAVVASRDGVYHVLAADAATGATAWQADLPWRSDNHGHHIQHPVIAQGRLFLEPHVLDWATGTPLDIEFPARSKCGTITAAANLLHYRDFNDEVWDLRTNTTSEFARLRSNCWIGMISGGGLLMSPESGGGCSCSWPVYTSLTYRTKNDY